MSGENNSEQKPPLAKLFVEPEKPKYNAAAYIIIGVIVLFIGSCMSSRYGPEEGWGTVGAWVVCGAIAAAIGKNKGIVGTGLILGFLLGPLGIAFVIMMDGNRYPCPYCKEQIIKTATVCIHCKRDLPLL